MEGYTLSFTVITGASPQAPRQDTVSTVKFKSSVVALRSDNPSSLRNLSRIGIDFLTWQAVPLHTLITNFPFGSREKFS